MANKDNEPLVSIITAGWNGKEFVHNLFDSIIDQSYKNIEYIYIDDGSTDGTQQVVEGYVEKFHSRGIPIKYIRKENGGISSAINCGLKHVSGKYLCWAEYDDVYMKDSIKKRVEFLETHPEYSVVTNDALIYSESNDNHILGRLSDSFKTNKQENQFEFLLMDSTITVAICHMVRTQDLFQIYPERNIYDSRIGVCYQMLLPLYYFGKRAFIDEALCKYIVRGDSISHKKSTYQDELKKANDAKNTKQSTLNIIGLPEQKQREYICIIEKIYDLRCLQAASRYFIKDDTKIFYKNIKKKGNSTLQTRLLYLRGQYKVLFLLYEKLIKGIRRTRYA